MYIQNDQITFRPYRTGERVPPPITEKWVDFNYPVVSGLQKHLEDAGYQTGWCTDTRLSTLIDLEGWEIVMERDRNGVINSFRLKGRDAVDTFVKRKRTAQLPSLPPVDLNTAPYGLPQKIRIRGSVASLSRADSPPAAVHPAAAAA